LSNDGKLQNRDMVLLKAKIQVGFVGTHYFVAGKGFLWHGQPITAKMHSLANQIADTLHLGYLQFE
jgi:hypothetical protein